jgi:7-carboxy-7-deazaguanine synthase
MKFSEVFHSVQGEGLLVGVPSVFFRTSYCNLRCVWCDSPYTSWSPEDRDISVEEASRVIRAYGCRHVVVTGGEPFIQQRELAELCALLDAAGHHITIETNATIYVPVRAHLISMSPKLASSNPPKTARLFAVHESKRIAPDVIRAFLNNYPCQVKFVVDAPDDLEEIGELVRRVPIPEDAVVLMPQGRDAAEARQRLPWLAEACKQTGYRLSPRLHLDIWGARRGV